MSASSPWLTNVFPPIPNQPNWHPSECTLQTGSLEYAYLLHDPNLGGNVLFLAIFALLIPAQLLLGHHYRTPGFTGMRSSFHPNTVFLLSQLPRQNYDNQCHFNLLAALSLGIVGYKGRIFMHFNPFSMPNFLIYLIDLTMVPVLIGAGIYLCLARTVIVYGEHVSGINARSHTLIFCGYDFFSLLLVAVGGGIAAEAMMKPNVSVSKDLACERKHV